MAVGYIKMLFPSYGAGGIGFVDGEGGLDIYFHRSSVVGEYSQLKPGQRVSYRLIKARPAMGAGPQAKEVRPIGGPTREYRSNNALNVLGKMAQRFTNIRS
jgi:cold shock CspA family protein